MLCHGVHRVSAGTRLPVGPAWASAGWDVMAQCANGSWPYWLGWDFFFFFFSLPGASNCCQKALGTFKVLTEKTAVVIFSALLTTNWPVLRLSWF